MMADVTDVMSCRMEFRIGHEVSIDRIDCKGDIAMAFNDSKHDTKFCVTATQAHRRIRQIITCSKNLNTNFSRPIG
jgi:hypothetical protein